MFQQFENCLGLTIYFPKETILYMVVTPLAAAQKPVEFITNQIALRSQTTLHNGASDKNAATMEITTLPMEVAREQDRAPVPKTHQALAWGSKASPEEEDQAGPRLPGPRRGWDGD